MKNLVYKKSHTKNPESLKFIRDLVCKKPDLIRAKNSKILFPYNNFYNLIKKLEYKCNYQKKILHSIKYFIDRYNYLHDKPTKVKLIVRSYRTF